QLMANGVTTSAQLAGLRQALNTFGQCPSVWMSATLEPSWLDTIDLRGKLSDSTLELTKEDYNPRRLLCKRMMAEKVLRALRTASSKDMRDVANNVLEKHIAGTQTLVVLNTVDRAKAVYGLLQELTRREKKDGVRLLLVHSRFRPQEREQLNDA